MFQKSSKEIGIWFQKEYSNRKRIFLNMKDLKRKIHYWCSDTMQNKITGKGVVCAVLDTGITQHPEPYMMTTDTEPMWQGFLPEMEKAEEACTAEWHRRRRSLQSRC